MGFSVRIIILNYDGEEMPVKCFPNTAKKQVGSDAGYRV